jgi:hypothetical protein
MVACAKVPSVLLVHRHLVHRHHWDGHKRRAISAPGPNPSLLRTESCAPMSWPGSAAVLWRRWASHRWGGCHLTHGGAWARLEALDSLRWLFLDVPVIHGPAVGVRPVLGSRGVDRPGQDPGGRGALAWRALDPWEAENGLWVFRRHASSPGAAELPGGSGLLEFDLLAAALQLMATALQLTRGAAI